MGETVARGEAKAAQIRAEGDATAERIRAEGSRAAADLLAESEVAVQLATISKTGEALDKKATFFFGTDPKQLGAVLANPGLVRGRSGTNEWERRGRHRGPGRALCPSHRARGKK